MELDDRHPIRNFWNDQDAAQRGGRNGADCERRVNRQEGLVKIERPRRRLLAGIRADEVNTRGGIAGPA